jgi:hypothetical protein
VGLQSDVLKVKGGVDIFGALAIPLAVMEGLGRAEVDLARVTMGLTERPAIGGGV